MSTETEKLKLKKPDLQNDEFFQFILDLASNFQTLDDVSEEYADSAPVNGSWEKGDRKWNSEPAPNAPVGWVNTRTGTAAKPWIKLTSYQNGDLVIPGADNGHIYICTQTGYSGLYEPVFPTAAGAAVQDTNQTGIWQASNYYEKDALVFPTVDNGRFYICIQAGESGDTEPVWQQVDGATTYDKNAVWASYRIAKWAENGISCLFRPFGMVE